MRNFIFEQVSDINDDYPYLAIYMNEIFENNPFMEISINNETCELQFVLYKNDNNIQITAEEWELIYQEGQTFFIKTIKNAQFY